MGLGLRTVARIATGSGMPVSVVNSTPSSSVGAVAGPRSGGLAVVGLGAGAPLGGDGRRGQCRGLFARGVGGKPSEHLDEIVLGVETVDPAVGQQRVGQCIVLPGFEAAEESSRPEGVSPSGLSQNRT